MSTNESKEKKNNKPKKKRKIGFTALVIIVTLCLIFVLFLFTMPNRTIKNQIKKLESKEEIVEYCDEKNLNCSFTTLYDYGIEGFKVSRVAFLKDDFFASNEKEDTKEEKSEDTKEKKSEDTKEKKSEDTKEEDENQKNVYITIQTGKQIELPN